MQNYWLRAVDEAQVRGLYEAHMTRDFPPAELPPLGRILEQMRSGLLLARVLTDEEGDHAYALTARQGGYALHTHLAVFPDRRGGGLGSELMRRLDLECAQAFVQVVEVENPDATAEEAQRHLRQRRIAFYQRAGYRVVQGPRYLLFGVDMLLMTRVSAGCPHPSAPEVAQAMCGFYVKKLPPAEMWNFQLTLEG